MRFVGYWTERVGAALQAAPRTLASIISSAAARLASMPRGVVSCLAVGGIALLLAVLGATVVGLSVGPAAVNTGAQAALPAPARPTFADEFNGPAGSAPDPARWLRETGGSCNGNNELQYYTDSPSNSALDGDGHLVITARRENPAGYRCWYGSCEYTSARLNTSGRFTQVYGRFEARIKVPRGQGIWPAFWMLSDSMGRVGWPASGEIDIMEHVGRDPTVNYGSLHGPGYSGGNPLSGRYDLGRSLADDFHSTQWTGRQTRSRSL